MSETICIKNKILAQNLNLVLKEATKHIKLKKQLFPGLLIDSFMLIKIISISIIPLESLYRIPH